MRTIYKYPLDITDAQTVQMPKSAAVLSVGVQGHTVYVWAAVDTDEPLVGRHFRIAGTGNPFGWRAPSLRFIGTVMTHGGHLVWHVFEDVDEVTK